MLLYCCCYWCCCRYLERYLWPNFGAGASNEHVLSIVRLVNEKFREGVPAWSCFHTRKV